MHTNTIHSNNTTTIVTTAPGRRETTTILYNGLAPVHTHYRRGLIIGIISSFAFVFWLIAMTTPIAMADYGTVNQTKVTVDPWHACGPDSNSPVDVCRPMGHDDESCKTTRDAFRVEQAFLLLTALMLIPLMCLAALDFSHKLDAGTPDLPFHLGTHWWMLFFAFLTALMSLVAFAVGFAIPRMNPCSNGALIDAPNFSWGPSPIFSLLIFVCALAMIILAIILRRNASVKSRDEMTQPHSPIIHPHEPVAVQRQGTVAGPVVINVDRHNEAVVRPLEPARV